MLALRKTDVVQEAAWEGQHGAVGGEVVDHTSEGFANEGMAEVGIGGSVYTMKSACATCTPAAAARKRRLFLRYIVAWVRLSRVVVAMVYVDLDNVSGCRCSTVSQDSDNSRC